MINMEKEKELPNLENKNFLYFQTQAIEIERLESDLPDY